MDIEHLHRFTRGFLAVGVLLAAGAGTVMADGTEMLGPPQGLAIASGSGIVIGGVGLAENDSASFDIDVPGQVRQVLLYWEGQSVAPFPTDDTIEINGIEVQGALIGGPTLFSTNRYSTQTYRADITDLNLVVQGMNSLEVGGLSFNFNNDGAGVLVIYDDGSGEKHVDILDGSDFAFISF